MERCGNCHKPPEVIDLSQRDRQSGLRLEQVIESEPNSALARDQDFDPTKWYSVP